MLLPSAFVSIVAVRRLEILGGLALAQPPVNLSWRSILAVAGTVTFSSVNRYGPRHLAVQRILQKAPDAIIPLNDVSLSPPPLSSPAGLVYSGLMPPSSMAQPLRSASHMLKLCLRGSPRQWECCIMPCMAVANRSRLSLPPSLKMRFFKPRVLLHPSIYHDCRVAVALQPYFENVSITQISFLTR